MNDTDNYDFYKPYLADQERVLWIGKPEKEGFLPVAILSCFHLV